tara:strand:+ start:2192 stop:2890 length:699 start_codon:yes stop_codon:yes gene_type:complete
MAKKVNKTEEQLANVEENLSKAALYVEKNQSNITKIIFGVVIIIGLFIGYNTYIINPKEKEASSEMFIAEFYLQNDDYKKALNGDGQYPGFLEISEKYSSTKAGNLANYYSAICLLRLGSPDSNQYFERALDLLNDFSTNDKIIHCLSKGLIGDANHELGNLEEALKYYIIAATDFENKFTTPYFLMKQAFIFEKNNDFTSALKIYNTIKKDYPKSKEGVSIDKYISSISNR